MRLGGAYRDADGAQDFARLVEVTNSLGSIEGCEHLEVDTRCRERNRFPCGVSREQEALTNVSTVDLSFLNLSSLPMIDLTFSRFSY